MIIIIGAGIGGLSVAQGLKKAGIPFRIFEKGSKDSLRQGYRVRINPDGAQALKNLLSDELWQLFSDSCAEIRFGMTMIDAHTGNIKLRTKTNLARQGGDSNLVFTADRTAFRHSLMSGLDDEIEFGKTFESYEIKSCDGASGSGNSSIIANFSDGTSITGNLLIGADGIRSKVRKQLLPDLKLIDTNGRCCYGKTPITNELLSNLPASIMEWTTMISTDEEAPLTLFLEPIRFKEHQPSQLPRSEDYIYWVLLSQSEKFKKSDEEMYSMNHQELKDYQLELIKDFSPLFKNVIAYCDAEKTSYFPMGSSSPDVTQWETNELITLLGDCIHAMPPTGGAGANSAIFDAYALVEAIKNGASVSDLNKYEKKMREYSKNSITGSFSGAKRMFGFKSLDGCKYLDL